MEEEQEIKVEFGRWYWYDPLNVPMMPLYQAVSDGSVLWVMVPRIQAGSVPKLVMETMGRSSFTELLGEESPY